MIVKPSLDDPRDYSVRRRARFREGINLARFKALPPSQCVRPLGDLSRG